jgi:hypothetical protein
LEGAFGRGIGPDKSDGVILEAEGFDELRSHGVKVAQRHRQDEGGCHQSL